MNVPLSVRLVLDHLDHDQATFGSAPGGITLRVPRVEWELLDRPTYVATVITPVLEAS